MEIKIGMDRDRSEEFVNPGQAYNAARKDLCNLCGLNSENRDVIKVIGDRDAEGGRDGDGDGRQK